MPKLKINIDDLDLELPPRSQPAYTPAIASRYTGIPQGTIVSWFFGTTYGKGSAKTQFEPVLIPALPQPRLLSFDNLIEAYVLRRFRVTERMDLRKIGKAIDFARNKLGIAKPLLEPSLLKVGSGLFIEQAGEYLGLTSPGQLLMPNWEKYFSRLEYLDEAVTSLFPVTRAEIDDSPRIISISPEFAFGRSVIDRIKVSTVVVHERFSNGDSIDELVEDFHCSKEEVEEALRAEWIFRNGPSETIAA